MSSAIGVGALRAQNACPLAAVIAEMPRADPLATSVDLTAKAALMVALCTAPLVTHEKLTSITTDVALILVN